MKLNPLTIQDPLSDKQIIINIQVNAAGNKSRDQRPVLVTAGISGKAPIMLSGRYGQLNQLIEQAWQEFSQNQSEPIDTKVSCGTTIAQVSVKPAKKPTKPNKESILSLF